MQQVSYFDGQSEVFTYTASGLRSQVKDSRGQTQYSYDNRDRLKSVGPVGAGTPSIAYAYDANSNRTALTTAAGTVSYNYTPDNRLSTITDTTTAPTAVSTMSYDGVRNRQILLLANGVQTDYTYDNLNRLTKLVEHKSVPGTQYI